MNIRTIGVASGVATEMVGNLDNLVSNSIARGYLAIKEDRNILIAKGKDIAFAVGVKAVVSALTQNSAVNTIADAYLGLQLVKGAFQAKSTFNKACNYSSDVVAEEVERLSKIEFDID